MHKFSVAASLFLFLLASCGKKEANSNPQDELLQLNQIQVIASHNSYRKHTSPNVFAFLVGNASALPSAYDPSALDYDHVNFDEQMTTYGIRGLEIDVYNDPKGGDFYNRRINIFCSLPEESGEKTLLQPGFKVLHIKDVDYNTHYLTFKQSLWAVRNWSEAHPNHLPLFINIETKQDAPGDNSQLAGAGFAKAIKWDQAAAEALDVEVKAVFGNELEKVITPDRIRNGAATLNEVVLQKKWPKLKDCRGKVVFIMQGKAVSYYLNGHPNLEERAIFVYGEPGSSETAFVILNDASGDKDTITQRVKEGYIVRTRSDADTKQARNGDYTDAMAAFASGAQIISTDYYRPDPRSDTGTTWTKFMVKLPVGDRGRKNPVSAAQVQVAEALVE